MVGCGATTTFIKVFYHVQLQAFQFRHPSTSLAVLCGRLAVRGHWQRRDTTSCLTPRLTWRARPGGGPSTQTAQASPKTSGQAWPQPRAAHCSLERPGATGPNTPSAQAWTPGRQTWECRRRRGPSWEDGPPKGRWTCMLENVQMPVVHHAGRALHNGPDLFGEEHPLATFSDPP